MVVVSNRIRRRIDQPDCDARDPRLAGILNPVFVGVMPDVIAEARRFRIIDKNPGIQGRVVLTGGKGNCIRPAR